ncbi:MAG TPA: DUF305 domain-containing protein [Longimicrobiaceae bacterium]|nr:DUF305 domain-containing protein [Longimicrobiaceae bacterium]
MKLTWQLATLSACCVAMACAPRAAVQATGASDAQMEGAHDHEQMDMASHELPAIAGAGYTAADVRFMQNMIGHHDQALIMAAMVPTHGAGEMVQKAAEKIRISQRDEIAFMERWLVARDQAVPEDGSMHTMDMPGMLTPAQLDKLDSSRGREFDRLFLEFMIQHHRGALEMVDTLLANDGAAQDPQIFRFVTDVDADQRAEIFIMQNMLSMFDTPQGSPSP